MSTAQYNRGGLRTPASCASCRCPFHKDGVCGHPDGCVPWTQPAPPLGGGLTIPLCPSCLLRPDGPSLCSSPKPSSWAAAQRQHPRVELPHDPNTLRNTPTTENVLTLHQVPNVVSPDIPAGPPPTGPTQPPPSTLTTTPGARNVCPPPDWPPRQATPLPCALQGTLLVDFRPRPGHPTPTQPDRCPADPLPVIRTAKLVHYPVFSDGRSPTPTPAGPPGP